MKTVKYLQALILILVGASVSAFGQVSQMVYDPLKPFSEPQLSAAEEQLLEQNALSKAREFWKKAEATCGEDFRVVGRADGSFTRKGAAQRAFLYEFCQTGNGWANNGLVVAEGDRIVAHFSEEGGWNMGMKSLPDINKNGFDELVVETSGGMHQGKIGGSVTVLEVSPAAVRELGYTQAFSNECDEQNNGDDCDRSYQITARASARPVFYRQKLINLGDEETTRWRKRGRLQKISLIKTKTRYRLLK